MLNLLSWVGVGHSDTWVSRPCLDVDVFSEEKPTPLRVCSAVSNKKTTETLPQTRFCRQ